VALTASQIIALACEAAHSPGKTSQAQQLLNAILSDLCRTYDFAAARGVYTFDFNPSLTTNYGSGPYPLPLDYLRASGSSGSSGAQKSFLWWLNGVPYPMVPVDLAEWDMQVQQAGLQSYPWLWATDMGDLPDDRVILGTTGNTTANSTSLTSLAATTRLAVGHAVAGMGIAPGSTIAALSGSTVTMTLPATETISGASVFFGNAPNGYAYPPPSGSYACQFRYQRLMPDIVDFTRVPWFEHSGYLIEKLTAKLCQLNDDSRAAVMDGGPDVVGSADHKLSRWLAMKDSETDKVKTVQLDRRTFGSAFSRLKNTKTIGW
jgi:hypothetical protein